MTADSGWPYHEDAVERRTRAERCMHRSLAVINHRAFDARVNEHALDNGLRSDGVLRVQDVAAAHDRVLQLQPAGRRRRATCHAPTGRRATCHAPTGRRATCHAPTGRTTTCHAPIGRPATCHAPTGRRADRRRRRRRRRTGLRLADRIARRLLLRREGVPVLRQDCATPLALQRLRHDVGEARIEAALELVLRHGGGQREDRHVDARGPHLAQRVDASED